MGKKQGKADGGAASAVAQQWVARGSGLREQMIQSGLALIERCGHDGLSLRAVARASGVSHMAPYGHFRNKHDLLSAVAAAGFALLRAQMTAAATRAGGSPRQQWRESAQSYVAFALRHPQLLRLMLGGVIPAGQQNDELRLAHGQALRDCMAIIAAGMARGEFRAADPAIVAFAGWSLLHGFSQLANGRAVHEQLDMSLYSMDAVSQGVIETLLSGLDDRPMLSV